MCAAFIYQTKTVFFSFGASKSCQVIVLPLHSFVLRSTIAFVDIMVPYLEYKTIMLYNYTHTEKKDKTFVQATIHCYIIYIP